MVSAFGCMAADGTPHARPKERRLLDGDDPSQIELREDTQRLERGEAARGDDLVERRATVDARQQVSRTEVERTEREDRLRAHDDVRYEIERAEALGVELAKLGLGHLRGRERVGIARAELEESLGRQRRAFVVTGGEPLEH